MASRFSANEGETSPYLRHDHGTFYDGRDRGDSQYDDGYDHELDHGYVEPFRSVPTPPRPCWIHIRGPDLEEPCESPEPRWIVCPEQGNASFLVLREQTPTPAALSRCSTPAEPWGASVTFKCASRRPSPCRPAQPPVGEQVGDIEAEQWVKDNLASFRKRFPDSPHERILLSLIHPKADGADYEYELDNTALEGIFSSVNEVFFAGQLTHRVAWHWSHEAAGPEYDSRVVGHTSLRESSKGGFETLVILSSPILRDKQYNRRLLISAFVHELIHCFLFIRYGFAARRNGGHTEGFRAIAELIDSWAGRGRLSHLYLCDMEADLRNFRVPADRLPPAFHDHHDHNDSHHDRQPYGRHPEHSHDRDHGYHRHHHHVTNDHTHEREYRSQTPDSCSNTSRGQSIQHDGRWRTDNADWPQSQLIVHNERLDFIDLSRHKAAMQPHDTFPRPA